MYFNTNYKNLEYFSFKGRPIEEIEIQKDVQNNKNYSGIKVSFVQNKMFDNKGQIDGYDSDPQAYNNSKLIDKSSNLLRKSQKEFKNHKETVNSFMQSGYSQAENN